MKKKLFGVRLKKILAFIGCLLLAFLLWVAVKYGEIAYATGIFLPFS